MGVLDGGKKKSNAKFFVRLLPSLDFALDSIKIESNSRVIHVKCLQNSGYIKKEKQNFWRFTADEIFYNKSQEDVYTSVCKDLVGEAVNGVSSLIVAFGQSGSGKTFTVSGLRHHYEDRGLLLRLLSSLCKERFSCRDFVKINISMSYVEFLRCEVKDLFGNRYIEKLKDITKIETDDEIDAWKSIFDAEVHKSFDSKAPYAGSDRGHTVFTFHVESMSSTESDPVCTLSKIHIVDMAGIDSGNAPTTWKCTSDIAYSNLSKALLEQLILCVTGKSFKPSKCICPFKATRILDYLQSTIKPYCLLRFVGHITGNESSLPLTLSVLRFGQKVAGFQYTRLEQCFSEGDPRLILRALEAEIERLKAELDLKDMLSNSLNYSNISHDKLLQIRRAVTNFLTGNLDKLTLLNLGQAEITLDVFREMYERSTQEKEQAVREAVLAAVEEIQSQLAPEKANSVGHLTFGQAKTYRRRSSRPNDQQISSTSSQPLKTSETCCLATQSSGNVTARVGQLDRKGISIGIKMSSPNFENPLTKALKKIRSRKSETVVRRGPKSSTLKDRVLPASRECNNDDFQMDLPGKVPSREEAWQDFYSERNNIIQGYQEEITKMEENVRIARKNYSVALCELRRMQEAYETTKKDWEDWKHVQNIRKHQSAEEEDDETFDQLYSEELQKREMDIDKAAENCHVTLIDLRNNIEELEQGQAILENEFQIFCEDTYKVSVIPPDLDCMKWQLEMSTESVADMEVMDQVRIDMYSQFRQKMLNYIPKKKKNKWVTRF